MDPGAPAEAQAVSSPPIFAPPPPPPQQRPAPEWAEAPPKQAGQLTPGWRLAFGLGWAAVIVCNAAVWEVSRVIGLSTWWLGADAEPKLLLLQLLPFYLPILVTGAAVSNWRRLPYIGIVVSLTGAAIGAADFDRVRWISVVELTIAGAALCISAASLAGMYRRAT
jgi:hypothetical protein